MGLPILIGTLAPTTVESEKLAIKLRTCSLFHTRLVACVGEGEDAGIGVNCE